MKLGSNTIREILNQPEVWSNCLETLDREDVEILIGNRAAAQADWLFIGCGTSYYLAQAAAASLTLLSGKRARAVPASEVLLFPQLAMAGGDEDTFPVLISRSGHTSEVLQVAEFLRCKNVDFLTVTCDGNELENLSSRSMKLPVVERSTVMTSSFTSMLIGLQYVAARISDRQEAIEGLRSLPDTLARLLPIYAPKVEETAQRDFRSAAILAQGPLFPLAAETALKIMESSSSYAESFHTLEFRHGPQSIASKEVVVGALLSETGFEEERKVVEEMKELGAQTFVVANQLDAGSRCTADLEIELSSKAPEPVRSALYVVWGQLLGAYVGIRKGLDPDAPRNLNRVVILAGN